MGRPSPPCPWCSPASRSSRRSSPPGGRSGSIPTSRCDTNKEARGCYTFRLVLSRSLLYVALPILLAASVATQQPVTEPDLPPQVHAVLDAAAAAPPAFQANTLIHLAGSSAVPHPGMRKILLERAFAVGANAQEPLK